MVSILIVDDDPEFTDSLKALLSEEGNSVALAHSVAEGQAALERDNYDLALVDLVLPDGSGLSLVRENAGSRDTAFAILTGHASIESALEALRYRVFDYLRKPVDVAAVTKLIERVGRSKRPDAASSSPQHPEAQARLGALIGASEGMRDVYRLIRKVAPTEITVLIEGESGSGKELAAQTIHALSRRARGPLSAVNCGAIAENLIASELFGHERGSFTGATSTHRGYFERVSGGTLFLDEITEMPLELQSNLLRVLETGRIVRVGGTQEISVDARIVAATNVPSREAVRAGRLREDLYYRLQVFPIRLPPLRERGDDVIVLARHFLERFNAENGVHKHLSREAEQALLAHAWPGNVRELRNAIERGAILAETAIDRTDLLLDAGPGPAEAIDGNSAGPTVRSPTSGSLREVEKQLVLATLADCGGDKRQAAQRLGVSLKTLYNKLHRYAQGAAPGEEDAEGQNRHG